MFDNKDFQVSREKLEKGLTRNEIGKLPDILQVLELIFSKEIKSRLDPLQSSYIADLSSYNLYYSLRTNDNSRQVILLPSSPTPFIFYRGQCEFFNPCTPPIYRGMSLQNIILARLRQCEFGLLLGKHPIVMEFNGNGYVVSYAGLAQHYELPTDILDLTNNVWTAAFFAITKCINGEYKLLDESYSDKFGVLYILDSELIINRIDVIGAQPFPRPSRQNALGLTMGSDENFNDLEGLSIIPFKHNQNSERIVYSMFYESRKLFPDDMLINLAREIKNLSTISFDAAVVCHKRFYPDLSETQFDEMCTDAGISFVSTSIVDFSEEDLLREAREWDQAGRVRLIKRIRTIPVTTL
jgi:hypothetical protein